MAGDGEGSAVAICPHLDGEDRYCEHVANARLIAAAPDLLAALVTVAEWRGPLSGAIRAMVEDAVKKARGEE